ncbi:MAG: hypothetical protein GF308_10815 [Candidatus Heimdallarchaeota archaeon]|nr:hypothetical protein [Candidatus Heimdallarchaeota archaeon]
MTIETEPLEKKQKLSKKKIQYSITKPSNISWIIYSMVIVILSIGYIFIIIDPVDSFFLPTEPEDLTFSYDTDEILLGLVLPNVIMILITPYIWEKIGKFIVDCFIKVIENNNVEEEEGKKEPSKFKLAIVNFLLKFFGIKVGPNVDYFVEKEIGKDNLNDVWPTFKEKILSAISTNIGITFIIAFILNFLVFGIGFSNVIMQSKDVFFLLVMIMQIVPFFVALIIPLNWTFENIGLRYIDSKNIFRDVGEEMSRGILQKFIGIGGLIMGISICYDLAKKNIQATIVYFVFFFMLLNAGTVVLISLLYLSNFHESQINTARKKLTKIFPLAITQKEPILSVTAEDIVIEEEFKDRKKVKAIAKLIVVLILAAVAIFGEIYILFIVGPF